MGAARQLYLRVMMHLDGSRLTLFFLLLFTIPACRYAGEAENPPLTVADGLSVSSLGKTYARAPDRTPAGLFSEGSALGGSTSVRRMDAEHLKWKKQGYFQRNRELGQVFTIPAESSALRLDAVVLRTGNSNRAVLSGAAGAPVHLTLFEVVGTPRIEDNGTPPGTEAAHGFTANHRADDFLTGITYQPVLLARGGLFPPIPATDRNGDQEGHLHYLRWDLRGEAEIRLSPGRRYAFLVGFSAAGAERGFTLGNINLASDPENPVLRTDPNGSAWWSVRREGDGTLPPSSYPAADPPTQADRLSELHSESLFAPGFELTLPPATDGFPDVDTYRTLEFYIEVKPVS